MKIYEVPKNSKIRIIEPVTVDNPYKQKYVVPEQGEELVFKKLDGMYSICYNSTGDLIRLAAWNNVEVLGPIERDGQ